jgi:hypothetical protein
LRLRALATSATRDGDLRAGDDQKVGMAVPTDGAHMAGLDIKVVLVEPMTAVTVKAATRQSYIEVSNPR